LFLQGTPLARNTCSQSWQSTMGMRTHYATVRWRSEKILVSFDLAFE
jgi:hypothetical protein